MENQLLAGFAKLDITPDYPIGLGGYSNAHVRVSEAVEDPIYATCIALTEGEQTVLVYTVDNCGTSLTMTQGFRKTISEAVGIPPENIFYTASHSHSCPALAGHEKSEQYTGFLLDTLIEAAKKALEDRASAVTMAAKKLFQGMNSTRHVQLANGEVAGSDWRRRSSPAIGNAGTPDSQMVLVKFAREGKRDILMINWQGHPDCGSQIGHLRISPSFIGPLRDTVAAGSGMEVAYFTGADGNMIIDSRLPEYRHNMNYRRYGVHMGTLVLELMDQLQVVEGQGIATANAFVEAEVDHSWDHLVEAADEVYALFKKTDRPTADALGKQYSFSSCYQARAIRTRYNMGKSITLEIGAFRVGGIGFACGSYEMFSESGLQIKSRSPYEYTLVLTGNSGYIPSKRAFANRCYESDTGLYAEGTAETLVDEFVTLLEKIQ